MLFPRKECAVYYGKDIDKFGSSDISRDDFWDISELIPKKKKPIPPPPPAPPRFAEISREREGERVPRDERARRIVFSGISDVEQAECEEYVPESNRLITRVCIRSTGGGYNFYERFKNDAARFFSREGCECPQVSFFSYIPQYSQMDAAQLDYYFYFRDSARRGESIPCDISYVFLYIYEIINLSGSLIPPEEGLGHLCTVWRLYYKRHQKINKFLAQWLCDYCLIYRLACPVEELDELLPIILSQSSFREFYLGSALGITRRGVSSLVSLLSDYDFRKSRSATGREELFERHIYGATELALREILSDARELCRQSGTSNHSIRAFEGSLCAHGIRKTIEVEYRSFNDTPELRSEVTGAVKYAENKLRAHMSVRSRLSATPSDRVRGVIDAYFKRQLSNERSAQPMPDYERRYEAPSSAPSFSDAAEIERLSWSVTRRLVPEGELEIAPEPEAAPEAPPPIVAPEPITTPTPDARKDSLLGETERAYLAHLLEGDAVAARRVLREAHLLEDSVAEAINEAADQLIGDVVLLPSDDGYAIVTDYLQEIREWMTEI